jgi:DNA (cytosine-5)-methyltransferase 1
VTAYYNEIDPEAVAVLKELIAAGVIAAGDVDGRSIKEVTPNDVAGYTQCHFFAGAGLWSVGARLAGWPDERPLWSGSCPCQGESLAGKRLGADDPRHLWPYFYRLIRACRPPVIVGEQVAAAAGTHWLDGVCADLAIEDYAARAVDIPACAIDAPHQRNRLYWIAVADAEKQRGRTGFREDAKIGHRFVIANRDGGDLVLANAESFSGGREQPQWRPEGRTVDGRPDAQRALGDAFGSGLEGQRGHGHDRAGWAQSHRPTPPPDGRNGSWFADAEWIQCHDGKARRAKPGTPMLVDGLVGRASIWRLAGNSILPQLAAEVLASLLDTETLCDCQNPEPESGVALVSVECPIHGDGAIEQSIFAPPAPRVAKGPEP